MEVASIISQQTERTSSSSSLSQLSEDYTRFLKLLTAQIAHQDPLAPMDSGQFVTQLAQLSQVEQSVKVNGNLESIQDNLSSYATLAGANLLGHSVTVASENMEISNSTSNTTYRISGPSTDVTAVIHDQQGSVVRTISGLAGQENSVIQLDWDGLDDHGQPLPDGTYQIEITALTEDGVDLPLAVFQDVTVEEFIMDFGQQYLALSNGDQTPLENILAVS